mmetsp:Transcript_10203/g.27392  ORF Transcript_10203/g.27392 Transcript_10203/m.27392 type:complete len:274 (-) Transcript_10203:659-1480(-)
MVAQKRRRGVSCRGVVPTSHEVEQDRPRVVGVGYRRATPAYTQVRLHARTSPGCAAEACEVRLVGQNLGHVRVVLLFKVVARASHERERDVVRGCAVDPSTLAETGTRHHRLQQQPDFLRRHRGTLRISSLEHSRIRRRNLLSGRSRRRGGGEHVDEGAFARRRDGMRLQHASHGSCVRAHARCKRSDGRLCHGICREGRLRGEPRALVLCCSRRSGCRDTSWRRRTCAVCAPKPRAKCRRPLDSRVPPFRVPSAVSERVELDACTSHGGSHR